MSNSFWGHWKTQMLNYYYCSKIKKISDECKFLTGCEVETVTKDLGFKLSPVLLLLRDTKGSRSWRVRTLNSWSSGAKFPSLRYPLLSSSNSSSRPLLGLESTKGGWVAFGFIRFHAFSSCGLGATPESSGLSSAGSTVQPAGSRGCGAE